MNLKTLLVASSLLLITACSTVPESEPLEPVEYYDQVPDDLFTERLPLQLEPIEPVNWRDFEWMVLNTERVEAMLEDGQEFRYYVLTPEDFQNLSLTTQDLLRYINSQRQQLDAVREYYTLPESEND